MRITYIYLLFLVLSCGSVPTIPDFNLSDVNGSSHSLYSNVAPKAIVLVWQGNGCPIFRLGYSTVANLQKEYSKRGISFYLINASPQDSLQDIKKEASEFNFQIPILKDQNQAMTRAMGVSRTMEVVVINAETRTVVFQGRVDDALGYEVRKNAKKHFLKNALDALLENKDVPQDQGDVNGCLINLS